MYYLLDKFSSILTSFVPRITDYDKYYIIDDFLCSYGLVQRYLSTSSKKRCWQSRTKSYPDMIAILFITVLGYRIVHLAHSGMLKPYVTQVANFSWTKISSFSEIFCTDFVVSLCFHATLIRE